MSRLKDIALSARESNYSVCSDYFFLEEVSVSVQLLLCLNGFTLKYNYVEEVVALLLSSGLPVVIVRFFSSSDPALRSRSGRSIINGNWAIDRPGKYEGGGTMFTYRRPNEISSTAGESFLAEGPTNEILDVYVSNTSTWTSRYLEY